MSSVTFRTACERRSSSCTRKRWKVASDRSRRTGARSPAAHASCTRRNSAFTWSRNASRSNPGSEAWSASTQPVTSRAEGWASPRVSASSKARCVLAVAPKLRA